MKVPIAASLKMSIVWVVGNGFSVWFFLTLMVPALGENGRIESEVSCVRQTILYMKHENMKFRSGHSDMNFPHMHRTAGSSQMN